MWVQMAHAHARTHTGARTRMAHTGDGLDAGAMAEWTLCPWQTAGYFGFWREAPG